MTSLQRSKASLVRNTLALDALNQGDPNPAIQAIQMGALPEDKLRFGLDARIRADHGWLSHKRCAAFLLGAASNVLSGGRLPASSISALNHFLDTL